MCGLCGELRLDTSTTDLAVIESMKEKLQKRGPVSDATYLNALIAFAHQRLVIINLSDNAAQSMTDDQSGVALND